MKRNIDDHELANQSYTVEGVALLEMAKRASELFEDRSVKSKRMLLNFVLSNSTWANGELAVEFRQPFDTIALGVAQCATEKALREIIERAETILSYAHGDGVESGCGAVV